MKPDSELQEALDTLIRVCQHMGAMFAANGVPLPELKDGECDLTISGSRRDIESLFERRIAELESLLDRTRNLANANLAEMDAKVSLLEAARNDLLLVVEELNDLRKTAEANALTPEEARHLYTAHVLTACVLCDTIRPKLSACLQSEEKP